MALPRCKGLIAIVLRHERKKLKNVRLDSVAGAGPGRSGGVVDICPTWCRCVGTSEAVDCHMWKGRRENSKLAS